MLNEKFDANWMNLFIFQKNSCVLKKKHFGAYHCQEGGKMNPHAKFGGNRKNGSQVIQRYVDFKTAADCHLELGISRL